jgi:predicted dehydrogenase
MKPRIAVAGVGAFGRNHVRVIHESPHAELSGIFDLDPDRAAQAVQTYGCPVFSTLEELARHSDAAVIATPTSTHSQVGCQLMDRGLDVMVEKPIAHTLAAGRDLAEAARRHQRILQVGHLERFNPAVIALVREISKPLFFEIHRMSEFSPRSLDVDVVLDLMIHDLDIVLALTGEMPEEIRAAGIRILSQKVDIANVRIQFASGCIANLTASRVSTERVRKMRLFQPHEYISLDYSRQDAVRFRVKSESPSPAANAIPAIDFAALPVTKDEPLRLQLQGFIDSIVTRQPPRVTAQQALSALEVAFAVLDKIEEHSRLVARTLDAQSLQTG